MAHGFQKFISEMFVNGKCLKFLPSENFPLYGKRPGFYTDEYSMYVCTYMCMYLYMHACAWI